MTALSDTETPPVLCPVPVGVKVTVKVQFAPAAKVLAQLLVWAKSPKAGAMLEMFIVPFPLFVNFAVCAALGVFNACFEKVSSVGLQDPSGPCPVPLKGTVCGLPVAVLS